MSENLQAKSLSETIQQAKKNSHEQALSTLTQQGSDFNTALKNAQKDYLNAFKQLKIDMMSEFEKSQTPLVQNAERLQTLETDLATILDTHLNQALSKLQAKNKIHMQQVSIMSESQKIVTVAFGVMLTLTLSALLAVVYRLQIWLPFLIVFAVILASIGITYALLLMQAQKSENN